MVQHAGSRAFRNATVQRMTIAVVCSYTVSLVNFRYRLLAAMVENGHEVVAFGPEDDAPTIEALAAIGVRFVQIPMARAGLNPLEDLRTLAALYRELRRLSPDLILCYTMKPIVYGLIAARLAGIKQRHALVTGLGYVFSGDETNPRLPHTRRLATWLYRIALRGNGRVFVYNQADADDILAGRMVRDPARILAVPGSGVDLQRYPASGVPEGPPVFLMVTRLLREKGAREFVEAARRLRPRHPQTRFQILGPLDPGPLAIPRDEIDRWVADGAIEYLGETADVRPYLAASTVFVLPSYYREGLPRSILEALATGRAVITADMPGCRDAIVEGENGFLVPPRDPEALAAAMQRFIDDPTLAKTMGRCSLEIARQRFDVEAVNRILLTEMELVPSTLD
ncbi:glycosyltransferase family 4 protein [Kaistia terrae]|uniref:Glycosyltransferase family 4 protein n=1 Tax=Kaistia terrae TaxID=537017 RepID=A0ABW0PRZ8_9HYPH|nr:glycosyltransferase family 4 protein [Kaistia terrae]MCX5578539.1 glycosyltransferase family 4 protein [Kaistia terrae]